MNMEHLQSFKKEISSIRAYLKHIEMSRALASKNADEAVDVEREYLAHLHGFSTEIKVFDYKAIVISMYGVLEHFINIWIEEHIIEIANIYDRFSELPETIKKNNLDLSIRLLSNIRDQRSAKYENILVEDVISRLNDCKDGSMSFKLNEAAFLPNSGNLTHSKIANSFKLIDVELTSKLKQDALFNEYLGLAEKVVLPSIYNALRPF